MGISFETLSDRQKYLVEARLRANEDPELARMPLKNIARAGLSWITPPERYAIMNFVKAKFDIALGRDGAESGWDIDTMPIADFGNVNVAGAATIRTGFNTFPLVNPAHAIGSLDPEPFELATLAAVSGDRQVGTSQSNIVLLLGAYAVHITGGAAVYQPAASTFNIRVVSTNGAVGGAFTTLATLVLNTATNFVDVIPINAPSARQISITGAAPLATIAALFNGDSTFCELVAGGALNVQANLLYAMLEVA